MQNLLLISSDFFFFLLLLVIISFAYHYRNELMTEEKQYFQLTRVNKRFNQILNSHSEHLYRVRQFSTRA
jgi:hypothetical protein